MSTPEPLPFDINDGVIVLTLEQDAPVVVLDAPLIRRLEATLEALPTDVRGLVLRSASEKVFVAGADLKSISAMSDHELHGYLAFGASVFHRLSQLPYPTAAAINGAALGGGLELAMHCDALIGAPSPSGKPYPVGLPEAGLSICPGWGGTNLLPARIDPAEAIRLTAIGKPLNCDTARDAGLFDVVVDSPGDLVEAATNWVTASDQPGAAGRIGMPSRWVGAPGHRVRALEAVDVLRRELEMTPSAVAVLDCVDIGISGGWEQAIQRERDHLVRLRSSPGGKAAISAFLNKGK